MFNFVSFSSTNIMSVGGSFRASFHPNSCSANQTANAAIRSGDVSVSGYFATASTARCLRASSNIPTDYYDQPGSRFELNTGGKIQARQFGFGKTNGKS